MPSGGAGQWSQRVLMTLLPGFKRRDQRPGARCFAQGCSAPEVRYSDGVGSIAWAARCITFWKNLEHFKSVGVDLNIDQQLIDTSTPPGKLLFVITGAFAEFERGMTIERIKADPNERGGGKPMV